MEALEGSGQQLTIFYSGSVRIFHHVPAHQAQAVMHLLSHSSSCNHTGGLDCTTNSTKPTQQPQLSKSAGAVDQGAKTGYPPVYCSSRSQPPTRPSTPATTHDTQIPQPIKKQALTISKRSHTELPFARKASLARFLEKRKDRVLETMKRNEDVRTSADGDDVEACGSPSKKMKLLTVLIC